MLLEIFMALVLIIAIIVIISLVKNTFGAIFKVIIGILLIGILAGAFFGLNNFRTSIDGNESIVLISQGKDLIRGFYKTTSDAYKEMSTDNFSKFKDSWNESKSKINSSIKIIKVVKDTFDNNGSELNKSELEKEYSNNLFQFLKLKLDEKRNN